MLRLTTIITSALAITTAAAAADLPTAPPVNYTAAPSGHSVQVEGTSNVHDWSSESSKIAGSLSVPGKWLQTDKGLQLQPDLAAATGATSMEVRIAVNTLKSSRGSGLDKKLYDAMDAKKHPEVRFVLDSAKAAAGKGSAVTWQAKGQMTIAGSTRPVDLDLTVTPQNDGSLRIDVTEGLKMSTFGIKPPTAMMGMARSADPVTVKATWIVRPQTAPVAIPAAAPSQHREQVGQLLQAYARAQHAMAQNQWPQARQALATVATAADELASLDAGELSEAARAPWQTATTTLRSAAGQAQQATSLAAARTPFATVSGALGELIELVGFEHDAAVTAYRMPARRGVNSPIWLHVHAGAGQKSTPVSSPYGPAGEASPEPIRIHLPAPVVAAEQ